MLLNLILLVQPLLSENKNYNYYGQFQQPGFGGPYGQFQSPGPSPGFGGPQFPMQPQQFGLGGPQFASQSQEPKAKAPQASG